MKYNTKRKSKKTVRKNKTKKIYKQKPHLKLLNVGYPLYASKKHEGDKLIEYTRQMELKSGDHCLLENSSWFGDLDVARSYKT